MKRFRSFVCILIVLWLLLALRMQPEASAAEGKIVLDKVKSRALEGNLLGDSATRNITIYLPPGYDENPTFRYPVVYLLHGYSGDNSWIDITLPCAGLKNCTFVDLHIKKMADPLIQQGQIKPMILVAPDANNRYRGSWYTNSATTGNWEDFITQDLVKYVDTTYRTLPQVQSRGIAGHSMGGYGALKLAMKHPEIYSAVYGLSPGIGFQFNFEREFPADPNLWEDPNLWLPADPNLWIATLSLKEMNQFSGAEPFSQLYIAMAAAFSPNPKNPPFFVDFPFERVDGELKLVLEVGKKWFANDPLAMVSTRQANLRKLQAIGFDVGTSDELTFIPPACRAFDKVLTNAGIPHTFEEFPGDHLNRLPERIETKVLPFFSDTLVFEPVSVQPRGKLTTTWATLKQDQ